MLILRLLVLLAILLLPVGLLIAALLLWCRLGFTLSSAQLHLVKHNLGGRALDVVAVNILACSQFSLDIEL